jgi:hypothetical protein
MRQFIELHRFGEFLAEWRRNNAAIPAGSMGES